MTNPTEQKQQYEGAILQQLVKNAEILAVIQFKTEQNQVKIDKIEKLDNKIEKLENKIEKLENKIETLGSKVATAQNWLIAIFIGIIINIFSQPILSLFN